VTGGDAAMATQTLLVMPWPTFRWMSTDDLKSIYAYLQAIPPVMNTIPADTKTAMFSPPPGAAPTMYTAGDWATAPALPPESNMLGAIPDPGNLLRGLAINPLSEVKPPADAEGQALFARGAYLFSAVAGCSDCHTNSQFPAPFDKTKFLAGGQVFQTPPPLQPIVHTVRSASANLIGHGNGFFTKATVDFSVFLRLITEGIHADDPMPMPLAWPMPWNRFRLMTLTDLQSIYTFVNAAAVQYGNVSITGTLDKVVPSAAVYCDAMNACPTGFACSSTTGAGECLNQTCTPATVLTDCAVCQTCTAGKCAAPAPTDMCLVAGY
jgi:hypothetical protein